MSDRLLTRGGMDVAEHVAAEIRNRSCDPNAALELRRPVRPRIGAAQLRKGWTCTAPRCVRIARRLPGGAACAATPGN